MAHARKSAFAALLALVGALLVVVGTPAAAAPATSGMHPAVGVHPHYRVAGQANPNARAAAVTFNCQTTTPATCYGPAQIRTAYGIDKVGATGAGRTVVIVDAYSSPSIQHDLDTFSSVFGLASTTVQIVAPDGLTPFDPADANQVGWSSEITLDVEWVHAVAPGATIKLVLARSNQDADILSATRYAVDHNLGDVISQSFGEAEQCMDPTLLSQQHAVFARAALKGITLLASSGDQDAAQPSCDGESFIKAVSTPASDPFVTGVGGTELTADGITGAYGSETAWNEPQYGSGTGGGFSQVYRTPLYQLPLHLASRGVPDVAYNAGIDTGVLVVWSESGLGDDLVFRFGGTSAGSPQWAGLVALAAQLRHARVGDLNLQVYGLAYTPAYKLLFHDVATGDNDYPGPPAIPGYPATAKWDPTTGWGTPRADRLVPVLGGRL